MTSMPWTPDFGHWPVHHMVERLVHTMDVLSIIWSDGSTSQHHVLLLRENAPEPGTIHPKAREMCASPTEIAADVSIGSASIATNGAVTISFSDGVVCDFHTGWLRGTAWFGDEARPVPVLWRSNDLNEPPSFDGPEALNNPSRFLLWLEALRDYGVARLRKLPQQDGLLEEIVTKIGPVRESNFGRQFVLEIKDEPDSQAYTSERLLQHIDMPTRESPHGIQFLYIRKNTTSGGEGIYVDAYRIAEDLRHEEPANFLSLVSDVWEYTNRARTSDYRARGPVVEVDDAGEITAVRYNTFLRAPMKAPVHVQGRAYRAYRAFCERAQDPRYQMIVRYEPGDLLAFDNRRALHGRAGYDAKGGTRFIEGIYSDRDDLHSRIRTLRRQLRKEDAATAGSGTG